MFLQILKLIRAKNLVIIIFTQYLMRYAVIFPMLESKGFESQFSGINFFLLVLTTVLLAAAGYVINDYFDTGTDLVNRPDTVVVGKSISRRTAMTLHLILNIVAVIIGLYISWQIHLWKLVIIYVLITGLLWYYSSSYKKMFLIGNIIVAVLTAMVPLMTVLYEIPALNQKYSDVLLRIGVNFYDVFFWIVGFSIFAFITTLNREIIKDAEDFKGDNAYGSRSLPVIAGIKTVKYVTSGITLLTIGLIIFAYFYYVRIPANPEFITPSYILIFLILPSLYLIYKIFKAKEQQDWKKAGNLLKLIMLFGVSYAFINWLGYHYF
jgi:4-hydroxybenzoate polyprenyltransferase